MVLQTLLNPGAGPNQGVLDNDLSSVLSSSTPRVLASNVIALDFDQNFQVLHFQQYTLMDNNWEVYTGGFVNSNQDGLLLYDRVLRDVRLLGFDSNLHITHNQPIHNVDGNWEVFSGDFKGAGRSQVLFYNPIGGNAQILTLKTDLSLADTKNYTGWGTNHNCSTGDDILVLNRRTGQLEQFVFSFGNQYQVDDTRSQGFVRSRVAPMDSLTSIDASSFSLLTTLNTSIRGEELY